MTNQKNPTKLSILKMELARKRASEFAMEAIKKRIPHVCFSPKNDFLDCQNFSKKFVSKEEIEYIKIDESAFFIKKSLMNFELDLLIYPNMEKLNFAVNIKKSDFLNNMNFLLEMFDDSVKIFDSVSVLCLSGDRLGSDYSVLCIEKFEFSDLSKGCTNR